MRPSLTLPTLLVAALLIPHAAPAQQAPPRFEVHEWGTFTSMVGSDGIALDGLHHEEEHLPGFVHDLARLAECGVSPGTKLPASRVTQKMETPVIYFHSDRPLRARVDVLFPQGLMTQFYPLPELVAPRLPQISELLEQGPIDFGRIRLSELRWVIDVLPSGPGHRAPDLPDCDPNDPWVEARRVDCAYVRTVPDPAHGRSAEAERYLFYRGLGRFETPLHVAAAADETMQASNRDDVEVPYACVVRVGDDGRGDFRPLGSIAPEATLPLRMDDLDPRRLGSADLLGGLGMELQHALTAQGLHDDEARAMVATWSEQWFLSPGTRLLWFLPRRTIDRLLMLRIEPRPTELVRVLVGRTEFLTPAAERRVESDLAARLSEDPTTRAAAERRLQDLDRFLEPQLRRALARSDSDLVRRSATELLEGQTIR